MRLTAPLDAITFNAQDIYGQQISLSDFQGKKVILSFFRDAACPFCNFRVFEFTHKYKAWKHQGVEIMAVFSSPSDEVRDHVARYPSHFSLMSDPELTIYNKYGVEKSTSALWKALIFKLPRIIRGMIKGGRPRPNPNVTLVPADFLINEQGKIEDVWYGSNTSDHIPLERIDAFIGR